MEETCTGMKIYKSSFHLRPALPHYNTTWDLQVVLDYIKDLGPNKRLVSFSYRGIWSRQCFFNLDNRVRLFIH